MADVGVVIAAGGKGRRMRGGLPKQFIRLAGKEVIVRAIAPFSSCAAVREIVVVVPLRHVAAMRRIIRREGLARVSAVVPGGRERQESVRKGLQAFSSPPSIVLVHDAVRPLVTGAIINRVIRGARRHGAAVAGVSLTDTVKLVEHGGNVSRTLRRDSLRAVQTPQGFRFDLLVRAHAKAAKDGFLGTDDAALLERIHIPVRVVPGDPRNIKITTRGDLRVAGLFLGERKGQMGRA